MASFAHITSRCFINVPFRRLQDDLDLILEERIQPEIGLDGDVLYTTDIRDFEELAAILRNADLACTLHAPFFDLSPGALDENIRKASLGKLNKAFALIPVFEPASIVCHLSYEENKHGYRQDEWFKNTLDTWQKLLAVAEKYQTVMMLENTYECNPVQHKKLLTALDSPYAKFCLDVGHVMAFAKNSWQDWLPTLTPWLGQLHLHDNCGDTDSHLAIGLGSFDFQGLFNYLASNQLSPIITLEPHTESDLWKSLATIDEMNLFTLQG